MLELNDIHTYYGDSYILQGVSLRVGESSVGALLGRNGVGKTTTVHSIIGFVPPRRGTITFKGRDITSTSTERIVGMGISLVPQGRRIFPSLTVKEHFMMAARARNRKEGWDLERIYSIFPLLKDRENSKGSQLSGGEQQMLAIGRALIGNPSLLLMDEPSEGLGPLLVKEFGRVIQLLKETGISILLVEQNFRLALSLADIVYVMSKGRIVYEGKPDDLRNNDEIKSQYLGV